MSLQSKIILQCVSHLLSVPQPGRMTELSGEQGLSHSVPLCFLCFHLQSSGNILSRSCPAFFTKLLSGADLFLKAKKILPKVFRDIHLIRLKSFEVEKLYTNYKALTCKTRYFTCYHILMVNPINILTR